VKLTLRHVQITATGAENARQSWPLRRSWLVTLTDAAGTAGVGEAAPLPGYSQDTLEDAERALSSVSAEGLRAALAISPPHAALAAVGALVPGSCPSARFALETAALDLLSRRRGTSAPALLGALDTTERPLAALLGGAASPTLLDHAERAFQEGYRCFKLKVGAPGAFARELEGASALRDHFGDAVALRLDANGGLSAADLSAHGATLQLLGLELFEEPGAPLPAPLPLALDESLQGLDPDAAEAVWRERSARAIVLKPTALGGLSRCWELAERAQRTGVAVVLSHAFEGPVAWRAAAALALALPASAPHGLAPYPSLSTWPGEHLPIRRGSLHAWHEPGLGSPSELASS
jgi:o-succinylbenzoate synthase